MKGRKPVGQIKLNCKIDTGDSWDWVVTEYKREELARINAKNAKKELKRQQQLLQLEAEKSEVEKFKEKSMASIQTLSVLTKQPLTYPANLLITSISIFDLIEPFEPSLSSTIGINIYSVTLECGSTKKTLKSKFSSSSLLEWISLNIICFIDQPDSNLLITLNSKSLLTNTLLGSFVMTGEIIIKLPQEDNGSVQIIGHLNNGNKLVGKLSVNGKLEPAPDDDDEYLLSNSSNKQNNMHNVNNRNRRLKLRENIEPEIQKDPTNLPPFPVWIDILDVTLSETVSVHNMSTNETVFTLGTGSNHMHSTNVFEQTKDTCVWKDLKWRFLLRKDLSLIHI